MTDCTPLSSRVVLGIECRASLRERLSISAVVFRIQPHGDDGQGVKARFYICLQVQMTSTLTDLVQMLGNLNIPRTLSGISRRVKLFTKINKN